MSWNNRDEDSDDEGTRMFAAVAVLGSSGDVTRNDSQRRFLAQLSITTLLRRCFERLQHCSSNERRVAPKIVVANRFV